MGLSTAPASLVETSMKFGTHIYQIILFLKSSLAIAISTIFKMAAVNTKWRHFNTAWLHVLSIYNTEPHAEFHGNKLHHCAMGVFAIYSFINSQVEIDIFQT
jgi:hypothetical protein